MLTNQLTFSMESANMKNITQTKMGPLVGQLILAADRSTDQMTEVVTENKRYGEGQNKGTKRWDVRNKERRSEENGEIRKIIERKNKRKV